MIEEHKDRLVHVVGDVAWEALAVAPEMRPQVIAQTAQRLCDLYVEKHGPLEPGDETALRVQVPRWIEEIVEMLERSDEDPAFRAVWAATAARQRGS